eukprot:gene5623-10835_t
MYAKYLVVKYECGHLVREQCILGGHEAETKKVFLVLVPARDQATLLPIIQQWVEANTTIWTEMWAAYRNLPQLRFAHGTVDHTLNNNGQSGGNVAEGQSEIHGNVKGKRLQTTCVISGKVEDFSCNHLKASKIEPLYCSCFSDDDIEIQEEGWQAVVKVSEKSFPVEGHVEVYLRQLYTTILVGKSPCHGFTKIPENSDGFYHFVCHHGTTVASEFMMQTKSSINVPDIEPIEHRQPQTAFLRSYEIQEYDHPLTNSNGFEAGVIVNGCVTKADLLDYLLFLKDGYVNEGDAWQFLATSHTGYMGSDYCFPQSQGASSIKHDLMLSGGNPCTAGTSGDIEKHGIARTPNTASQRVSSEVYGFLGNALQKFMAFNGD